MIPKNITAEHVDKALEELDSNGSHKQRESTRWNLVRNGRTYPPKLVISVANKFANNEELSPDEFSGGSETNAFLEQRGYKIEEKKNVVGIPELIVRILDNYPRIYEEDCRTNNPEFRELIAEAEKTFKTVCEEYKVKLKPFGGQGKMRRQPSITFFYPGHRMSKGFGVAIGFQFDKQTVSVGLFDSDDNPPPEDLSVQMAASLREQLPEFSERSKDDFPRRYLSIEEIEERLVEPYLEEALRALRAVLDEHREEMEAFLGDKIISTTALDDPFSDFIKGREYTADQVSKVSGHNRAKGIHPVKRDDALLSVAILSTIGGQDYANQWLDEEKTLLKYYMEGTTTQGVKTFERSKHYESNKAVTNDVGAPVHLFVRDKKREPFIYKGKFSFESYIEEEGEDRAFKLKAIPEKSFYWINFFKRRESEFRVGDTFNYQTHTPEGNKAQVYGEFKEGKAGDLVVGYSLSPAKRVSSLWEIDSPIHEEGETEVITLRKLEDLSPISDEELREKARAAKVDVPDPRRGTFFAISEKQFNLATSETATVTDTNLESMESLNTIFYGPPGTGKTFYLKQNLFERFTTRAVKQTAEKKLAEVVEVASMWQVLGAALVDNGESNVTDLMAHPLVVAKMSVSKAKEPRRSIWAELGFHAVSDCENVKVTRRLEPLLFHKNEDSTWKVSENAKEAVMDDLKLLLDVLRTGDQEKFVEEKRYEFVTFHQSFSYEDFIEGIKPVSEDGLVTYEIQDGVFKRLCDRARVDKGNNYAIFIDEINRGNIASIFGELITLIEEDKREGKENTIPVRLPYSKKWFTVPENLYIYGTMNTADKSVEALDAALRRRFAFVEMMPECEFFTAQGIVCGNINLEKMLRTINLRVERLLDRDHTIGHAYFHKLKGSENSLRTLQQIFRDSVIPLLKEYFFGDFGRIGLVLGSAFIEESSSEAKFADFEHIAKDEFEGRSIFTLVDPLSLEERDFISIYSG